MQFLRTLFWVLLAGVAVAFAFNNWTTVPLRLWGGLIADVNLPLLLVAAFLAGFLPMYLTIKATRWRWRQRVTGLERTIGDLTRPAPPAPATPAPATPVMATPGAPVISPAAPTPPVAAPEPETRL